MNISEKILLFFACFFIFQNFLSSSSIKIYSIENQSDDDLLCVLRNSSHKVYASFAVDAQETFITATPPINMITEGPLTIEIRLLPTFHDVYIYSLHHVFEKPSMQPVLRLGRDVLHSISLPETEFFEDTELSSPLFAGNDIYEFNIVIFPDLTCSLRSYSNNN